MAAAAIATSCWIIVGDVATAVCAQRLAHNLEAETVTYSERSRLQAAERAEQMRCAAVGSSEIRTGCRTHPALRPWAVRGRISSWSSLYNGPHRTTFCSRPGTLP